MKSIFPLLIFIFIASNALSQEYYVSSFSSYYPEKLFITNSQSNPDYYNGTYLAVSETYESSICLIINAGNNSLNISLISGVSIDCQDWNFDTTYIYNVPLNNGCFTLSQEQTNFEISGNLNFRLVNSSLYFDGNRFNLHGIIIEEYTIFAAKEI